MSDSVQIVDVTYRGISLARRVRLIGEEPAFLEHEAPMPVGTLLTIVAEGGPREGRVIGVVEQEGGAKSPPGMRLSFAGAQAGRVAEVVEADAAKTQVMEAVSFPQPQDDVPDAGKTETMEAVSAPEGDGPAVDASADSSAPPTDDAAGGKKKRRRRGR